MKDHDKEACGEKSQDAGLLMLEEGTKTLAET